MKFVALALALLLAVGSHAASLQADAPSQLAHARAVMDVYLTQVKDSATKALEQLDDTEYKELKASLSQRIDTLYNQIKSLQASVSPVTDNVVSTISEATNDFRTSLMNDINTLKADLEPKRLALKEVIDKHIAEYHAQLDPIITEYAAQHTQHMDALKAKLDPVVEQMRTKVAANVEETKTAMMPIVEAVRAKISTRLEEIKAMATPYVEEYKGQIKEAYDNAQGVNAEELTALQVKIAPMVEDIKTKLYGIFEAFASSVTKN